MKNYPKIGIRPVGFMDAKESQRILRSEKTMTMAQEAKD